jgi:hypothetical protein
VLEEITRGGFSLDVEIISGKGQNDIFVQKTKEAFGTKTIQYLFFLLGNSNEEYIYFNIFYYCPQLFSILSRVDFIVGEILSFGSLPKSGRTIFQGIARGNIRPAEGRSGSNRSHS